jgi:hypothetical protein
MASEESTGGSVSSCSLARISSSEATSDFAHPSGDMALLLGLVDALAGSAALLGSGPSILRFPEL